MSNSKRYWNSIEQLTNDPGFEKEAQKEFSEYIPVDEFVGNQTPNSKATSRRDFLKFLGFSLTAATLAACETPVTKSIPYVVKPEEVTPGVPNYYATTYYDGLDYASILVKTREGRPIFIEGNKLSGVSKGSLNARINSSVLSLYDSRRYSAPLINGEETDWSSLDAEVKKELNKIKANGGNVRLLTYSINSPSTLAVIENFGKEFNKEEGATNFKHIQYDAVSFSAIRDAHQKDFGFAVIPDYNFSKADVIVSLGADFLSNWPNSASIQGQYSKNRKPSKDKKMSKHYQFEANMSLTGSNADVRGAVRNADLGAVATMLYNKLVSSLGQSSIASGNFSEDDNNVADKVANAAKDLMNAKGKSLVVCGVNDPNIQSVINGINQMLSNYGATLDLNNPLKLRNGNESAVVDLVNEMKAGKVDALLVYGVDPLYSIPASSGFAEAMEKVSVTISLDSKPTFTSKACKYVAPDNNFLESWGDSNPKGNYFSILQPTINPLYSTRQAQASLMSWAGLGEDFYAFLKTYWQTNIFPMAEGALNFFDAFWNKAVHDGVFEGKSTEGSEISFTNNAASSATKIKSNVDGIELNLYVSNAIGDGSNGENPWLQELPDPVTKVVWDNYITMNPVDMMEQGYETKTAQETPADLATVTIGGNSVKLPVVASPGQKTGTIGIALGYGKGKAGEQVIGENVFPFTSMTNGFLNYSISGVTIEKANETYPIASTQTHHTMMGRKIVNETSLETFKTKDKQVWNEDPKLVDAFGRKKSPAELDLWAEHPIEKGHRWGISIDLNACTGCGACVTACHAENNVPVVGKDEVRRTRTMSWLRIDRYYSSDADPKANNGEKNYAAMEEPSKYPQVVYQPIMCQHCNHAPCETVCPVAATTHSNEGLNQMAYNRCVGTRYCANNCPFKVRRFNWFNYVNDSKFVDVNPAQDELMRMVLNPDVTVRSRGVMEKCSMCVQRIQAGKLQAKKDGTPVQNGAIQTACSAACNGDAIVFGDINDQKHEVWSLAKDDRAYVLLEELGVKPNIYYQTKVRNVEAPAYEKNIEKPVEEHSA